MLWRFDYLMKMVCFQDLHIAAQGYRHIFL